MYFSFRVTKLQIFSRDFTRSLDILTGLSFLTSLFICLFTSITFWNFLEPFESVGGFKFEFDSSITNKSGRNLGIFNFLKSSLLTLKFGPCC